MNTHPKLKYLLVSQRERASSSLLQLFSRIGISKIHLSIQNEISENCSFDAYNAILFHSENEEDLCRAQEKFNKLNVRTPVIVLTDSYTLSTARKARSIGFQEILSMKDLDAVSLYQALERNKVSTEGMPATEDLANKLDSGHLHSSSSDCEEVIWDCDLEKGKVRRCNNFQKVFGYASPQWLEDLSSWKQNLHPDDYENATKSFQNAVNNKEDEWLCTYRFRKNNGSYTYVRDKAIILRDKKGRAYRAIGSMQDLSQVKVKEQRYTLLESVVRNSNDAILITEAKQLDEPGPKIIYANNAFYEKTGYTANEVIGRSPRFLQGPKTDRLVLDEVRKTIEGKQGGQFELINYTKSGEEFWVEFSIAPVGKGEITHFISIQRDITDRKTEEFKSSIFRRINAGISQSETLEDRYQVILEQLIEHSEFELAEGWLTNIDNSKMSLISFFTKDEDLETLSHEGSGFTETITGIGLPGKVWQGKDIIKWHDLPNHSDFIRKEKACSLGIHSCVAVPIIHREQVVGAITLFSRAKNLIINGFQDVLEGLSALLGAEFQRMKSERELDTFFELSPGILSVIDEKGNFKKVNPSFSELLGYYNGERENLNLSELIIEEDWERFSNVFFRRLLLKNEVELECRCQTKSNDIIWLNWKMSYSKYDQLIYAVAKDITENKKLENLLQDTNQLAKVGSWEYDVQNGRLYWSDMVKNIFEVPTDYQPKLDAAMDFYKAGRHRQNMLDYLNKSLSGDISRWKEEAIIITGKGHTKWVRIEGKTNLKNGKAHRMYGSVQDITDYKAAQNTLYETNLRYQLATKANKLGIWDWDLTNDKVVIDDTIYMLWGVPKGAFNGTYDELLQYIHLEDTDSFQEQVQQSLESKDNLNLKFRVCHPDGTVRHLHTYANIIRDPAGQPTRLIGINFDVTDEIRQQQKITKAHHEKERILESIMDGFFTVDEDWTVSYWNAAAERILQTPREKVISNNLWTVFKDATPLLFYEKCMAAMKDKKSHRFQEYYPPLDIWLEVIAYPQSKGLTVHFKDISQSKKQEDKITQMKNLQKHVINSTQDIIWAIDREYRLILGNRAYFKQMKHMTGVDYELGKEVITSTDRGWDLNDSTKKEWLDAYHAAFQGKVIVHKFTYLDPKGIEHHYNINIHPIKEIDNQGNEVIKGLACFSREMTKEFNYIEAIEKQNERLREIAWMQSHIVRTPVSRILGLVQTLLQENEDLDLIQEYLPYIQSSAEELDEIIHRIVDKTERLDFDND